MVHVRWPTISLAEGERVRAPKQHPGEFGVGAEDNVALLQNSHSPKQFASLFGQDSLLVVTRVHIYQRSGVRVLLTARQTAAQQVALVNASSLLARPTQSGSHTPEGLE